MNICKLCNKPCEKILCHECQEEENDLLMARIKEQRKNIDTVLEVIFK